MTEQTLMLDNRVPHQKAARAVAICALMLGAALVLSWLELLVPIPIPLPGVKLGLANIAVVIVFTRVGKLHALAVSFARVALTALLFGNIASLAFSATGAAAAYAVMLALSPLFGRRLGYIGLCTGAAAAHNFGQIIAACALTGSPAMLRYLPILLIAAAVTGAITGSVCLGIDTATRRAFKIGHLQ